MRVFLATAYEFINTSKSTCEDATFVCTSFEKAKQIADTLIETIDLPNGQLTWEDEILSFDRELIGITAYFQHENQEIGKIKTALFRIEPKLLIGSK